MRKKLLALLLAACACVAFTSCAAGPHQLRRTVDDWDHEMYVNSPWLNGILWVVPFFPLLHFGAGIGDFFVVDAYSFWINDAWDGEGTGFERFPVNAPGGVMQSLWIEGSGFLQIKK